MKSSLVYSKALGTATVEMSTNHNPVREVLGVSQTELNSDAECLSRQLGY